MRKVFSSPQYAEVGMLESFLEEEGIDCMIIDSSITTASGYIPITDPYNELWVMQDNNYEKAKMTVDEWLNCKP